MLRFLYTNHLTLRQENDALGTYTVADYFMTPRLSQRALARLERSLQGLVDTGYWQSYRRQALFLLSGPYVESKPGALLVQVTARNVRVILNDSGVWDQIAQAHPDFAGRVLKACFSKTCSPKVEEPFHPNALKRPASRAFDDIHRQAQASRRSGEFAGNSSFRA